MCSCVTFEIEGVVESFSTECTQISFDSAMTFHMSIQQTLKRELLLTHLTNKIFFRFLNYNDSNTLIINNWHYILLTNETLSANYYYTP